MAETRNIIILGASYAGLGITHYFLKHVYPHLAKSRGVFYKVILVNPSSKFFLRHAAPRAVASSELMPNNKIFLDIEPGFTQYGDNFTFKLGKAIYWDTEKRLVVIKEDGGAETALSYHALILATGSKTPSPLLSNWGVPYGETQEALAAIHKQLETATSVVIAGGGPAGVETAGEVGEYLNGATGYFSWRPAKPKAKIILLTSSDKLLPVLRPAIAKQAEIYLNRVGVNVRYNTKLESTEETSDGKTKVILANGEELHTDIYIPAMGMTPLSAYVPARLRNEKGAVLANEQTLRVDAAGPRVYALGDIASFSRGGIVEINDEIPILATNIKRDLLATHDSPDAKPNGPDRIYKANLSETQLVPVGRSKGVGALFGWRTPSWAVWIIKGRDYMLGRTQGRVSGEDQIKEVKWVPGNIAT